MNEDDEAMEAASNIMETTTNSSSSSGSSVMEDAASEKEEVVTMEDAAVSPPPNDDIAMQDEEGNEEMGVAAASSVDEVDEPMEDKAEIPREETMKVTADDDDNKEVDAPIPKKMSDTSPEKAEEAPKKQKTLTADAASDFRKSLGLHDCLSLGEIELGLMNQKRLSQDATADAAAASHHRAKLEIQRLPYILRLLSNTRPLASISVVGLLENNSDDNIQSDDDQKPPADALVDGVVESLEDVAATYSIAEAVDVVTNHLAPSLTKKISRLKPLTVSTTSSDGTLLWDTDALADVAKDPITIPSKRKRGAKAASTPADKGAPGGGTSLSLSSDDAASGDDDPGESSVPLKKRKQTYRRDSVEVAAEDSQEATFTKTLSELASLVVRSRKNNGSENTEAQTEEDPDATEKETGSFSLRTDDSILSDAFRGANEGTGGAMEGSDLGSTVTTIMHHAPVIRSRQLAGALCRASLQQTGDLISRLAANCPTCSPALLLGCIESYSTAIKCKNNGIADTAKECAMALAKLSNNERTRVYNKLQSSGVMLDVQLRLATELGSFQLSCFITQHLTPLTTWMVDSASTIRNTIPRLQRQDSRDSSGGIPNDENEDLDDTSHSEGSEPTLLFHLLNNPKLYAETIECLGMELSKSDDNFRQSQGRWSLTLRSLALLLLAPLRDTEVVKMNHSALVKVLEQVCNAMQHLDLDSTPDTPTLPDCASTDRLYGLFSSCGFLLMAMMLTHDNSQNSGAEAQIAERFFDSIKKMHTTSHFLDRSWNSVQNALTCECPRSLFACFMTPIAASFDESMMDMFAESILVGLKALCKMFGPRTEKTVADKQSDVVCRAAALLQLFRESASCDMGKIVALTKDLMGELLENDQGAGASLLVCSIDVLRFIAEGTALLEKEESMQVPFVLPVKLDETWTKISVGATGDCVNDTESTFLLRLLYALEYMDSNTSTLFAVDPWFLPIKQALSMAERVPSKQARDFLSRDFQRFVKKYSLELTVPTFFESTTTAVAPFDTMTREKLMETLYLSIRSIVNEETTTTVNNIGFLFLQVRARLCDADLFSTVSSACLSSPNNPTPRYSYSLLCQDPLVILRYPLSVWSKKCLRRILLTTLRATLVAHNAISFRDSPREGSADELLVARDAIVTRCVLAVTHGGDSNDPQICSATTSFVRWLIISSRPGLVGLLVKQGLGESDVDWLVENVPEIMSDAQSLLHILSDRSFMTASERLAMADTIIRIAIVHGSDFSDDDAAQMTAGALSQLVDSFYLVLGPVGVPVTALLHDDSGTDITQNARKAAFRILKALIKVRGRRHAFQVCGVALQKLATMCKAESASLQGATAPKRKQLLKEVYDTAAKAVGISGGGHS